MAPRRVPAGRKRAADRLGWYELRLRPIRLSTRQAEGFNIALADCPSHLTGPLLGVDAATGQLVCHSGFAAYAQGVIESPNVLILGDLGNGKSSLIKTVFVLRPLRQAGHDVAVIDKKLQKHTGEYTRLAQALGVTPIRFAPDSGVVINPLDPRISAESGDGSGQLRLVIAILEVVLGRPLGSTEHYALACAHRRLSETVPAGTQPILADLDTALRNPHPEDAAFHHVSLDELRTWGREAAMGLERLIDGDLGGMINGPTSAAVDLAGRLIVFDVSGLAETGPSIRVVMAIINTFLTHAWARPDGRRRTLIIEEGWHLLDDPATARLLKANYKISRGIGLQQVAALHHLSDLPEQGQANSDALTLLKEAETLMIFAQSKASDITDCVRELHLPAAAGQMLQVLAPGFFLFTIGQQAPRVIEHLRSDWEVWITDTDDAMLGVDTDAAMPELQELR